MTIVRETVLPPCADDPSIFLDELLQAPPARNGQTAAALRVLQAKRQAAHRQCAACPVFVECLYRAVAEVDVAGFVACTTESDRRLMRRRLGISVRELETPAFGAPRTGGGPVNHEAVMSLRQTYPQDTCQQLAERLGCSTSTVKRHLRKAREESGSDTPMHAPAPAARPSIDDVLDAFDDLDGARVA